jgi:hypothetical protein
LIELIYKVAKVISGSMASSNDESKDETAHLAACDVMLRLNVNANAN